MDVFFWIVDLLLPLALVLVGVLFIKRPPKKINGFYGYRTFRSMKSQSAWDFAHQCYGKISLILGSILLGATLISKLTIPLPPEILSQIHVAAGIAALVTPIFTVERQLKKRFDKK